MTEHRHTVRVEVSSAGYDITIGPGVLRECGEILARLWAPCTVAVISDKSVRALYFSRVCDALEDAGFSVREFVVPPGETTKNWAQAGDLLEALAAEGLDRTDAVLALGGGVVGDLAGFVAATYLRGIAFAQVPTTLLAQVDSSVGGKTGVDLTAGKNLAGAFIQPDAVIADTDALSTLPQSEWLSGLAEAAKSAVLDGETSLAWLEGATPSLAVHASDAVTDVVRMCVSFKARVVASDERESGARECLNLGHTLGHAIEKVAGYGVVPHGVAVAEGMRFAARLAVRVAGASEEHAARQEALLYGLGLSPLARVYDCAALRNAMSSDKKARGGRPRFVLSTGPGEYVVTHVEESVLAEELAAWAAR